MNLFFVCFWGFFLQHFGSVYFSYFKLISVIMSTGFCFLVSYVFVFVFLTLVFIISYPCSDKWSCTYIDWSWLHESVTLSWQHKSFRQMMNRSDPSAGYRSTPERNSLYWMSIKLPFSLPVVCEENLDQF